jgi:SAM-dependent methyltransferase
VAADRRTEVLMSMEVLKDRSQIRRARGELKRLGLSQVPTFLDRLTMSLRGEDRLRIGDRIKSWDVLRTVEFIKRAVARAEPILDIGCYASEMLPALYDAGYRNLSGVDLNPRIDRMPHADSIRYEIGDFMRTPFAAGSFKAITAISVIEHGFDRERLLTEMARLLEPGAHFIASFDYWPDKIDTTGVRFFDLDWMIFSRREVDDFVAAAARHGLRPIGAMDGDAAERVVKTGGREYTFAWLVLEKSR